MEKEFRTPLLNPGISRKSRYRTQLERFCEASPIVREIFRKGVGNSFTVLGLCSSDCGEDALGDLFLWSSSRDWNQFSYSLVMVDHRECVLGKLLVAVVEIFLTIIGAATRGRSTLRAVTVRVELYELTAPVAGGALDTAGNPVEKLFFRYFQGDCKVNV